MVIVGPKAIEGGIFGRFSKFHMCRLEVAGDVMAGAVVDQVGMDVHVNVVILG